MAEYFAEAGNRGEFPRKEEVQVDNGREVGVGHEVLLGREREERRPERGRDTLRSLEGERMDQEGCLVVGDVGHHPRWAGRHGPHRRVRRP